jgi:hypothetical protein
MMKSAGQEPDRQAVRTKLPMTQFYGRQEIDMPSIPRAAFLNVTDPPFNADPTGTYDSTQAFQAALNAAGNLSVALDERQSNIVFG